MTGTSFGCLLKVVMKRAQNVAQAVVRTRSSLSSWSCMGARRRNVGPLLNSKEDGLHEDSLIIEKPSEHSDVEEIREDVVLSKVECSSSGGSGHEDTDEEEQLIPGKVVTASTTAEDITEGELWYELEKELQRQEVEVDIKAQEEEAAAAKEITEEENLLADAAESDKPITTTDTLENHHFYPPGRIMHIVSVPSSESVNLDSDEPKEEHVGIYETPRGLYNKLRLSKTMINDHYMPMYKKMMELLIRELENDEQQ